MGCGASKPFEGESDVVSILRVRKRLMKSTIDNRRSLAEAHCRYYHSLFAVSAAIRLFVARNSSASSPFLITFPSSGQNQPEPEKTQLLNQKPMLLQQTPSEPTHEFVSSKASVFNGHMESENVEEREGLVYGVMGSQWAAPQTEYEWEFFNPFASVITEVNQNVFDQGFDEQLREIREREGIPELEEDVEVEIEEEEEEEEEEEKIDDVTDHGQVGKKEEAEIEAVTTVNGDGGENGDLTQWEKDSFRMIEVPNKNGRELLEVLKDVEDHFIRAYESGMEVSQLLEADIANIQSAVEEIKDSSDKLIQSTTWNQTTLQSTSRKSFLESRSINSSSWTQVFYHDKAMKCGSHSITLGKLYAWEEKLYEEVKAGDETRKIYDRKFAKLLNQDAMGDEGLAFLEKISSEVKELNSRIMVAIGKAETISEKIRIIRDQELQPQIIKLLYALMMTWKIMSDSHEGQNKVIHEMKSFESPTYGKFCNDSHRLATLQLEAELQNWRLSFAAYISAQKAYIESLNGWVSKFTTPDIELYSKSFQTPSEPNLFVICRDWSASFKKLPVKPVSHTMKLFGKNIRKLWIQQSEEMQQKRKVDGFAKELDRRVCALQKAENTILVSKILEQKSQVNMQRRVEYLTEKKDVLALYRKRLDAEKAKHHSSMQKTQMINWTCFQKGFGSVFESLKEFSVASVKIYSDLVTYSENESATSLLI